MFTDKYKTNIDNKINNNYAKGIDIYASDVKKYTSDNGSNNYKIVFDNGNDTNFYYSILKPTSYSAKVVYLYGIIHNNIAGITDSNQCIGELVIEHTNNSTSNKVYTCYLLSATKDKTGGIATYNSSSPYNIDDFINFVATVSSSSSNAGPTLLTGVIFNNIIGDVNQINKQYIYYKDTLNKNNTVIVYLTPIIVNNTENITILSKLSSQLETMQNRVEGFIEGLETSGPDFSVNAPIQPATTTNPNSSVDANTNATSNSTISDSNNDIYIDCSPTGYSKTEIETYNIPINSDILGNKQQMDVIKISIYFLIFIFIIFILFFSVPYFYKKIVIDATNKYYSKNADIDILTRIRSIDIWISSFVLIYCFFSFSDGFNNNNSNSLMTGLFLFIIFGVSVSLIQYNKSETEYMKTIINNCSVGELYNINDEFLKYLSVGDIFDTIKNGFMYYFKDVFKLHMALVIISSTITLFYFLILGKNIDSKFFDIVSYIITTLFPISFIIQIFIS